MKTKLLKWRFAGPGLARINNRKPVLVVEGRAKEASHVEEKVGQKYSTLKGLKGVNAYEEVLVE